MILFGRFDRHGVPFHDHIGRGKQTARLQGFDTRPKAANGTEALACLPVPFHPVPVFGQHHWYTCLSVNEERPLRASKHRPQGGHRKDGQEEKF